MRPLRLLHFGAFDHDNYGDLLFPLLLENRLKKRGMEVIHVSPGGVSTPWLDALPSEGFESVFGSGERIDGVVIGGGDIILEGNWSYPASRDQPAPLVLPGLWLGASAVAARWGVPLVWNAPGMAHPFPSWAGAYLQRVLKESAYVSVRDHQSRQNLSLKEGAGDVAIVPDSAYDLKQLWPVDLLAQLRREFLVEQGIDPEERLFVVFVFATRKGDADTLRAIQQIARITSARPVFVEICPWQSEPGLYASLAAQVGFGAIFIERPTKLKLVAALIAGSALYVGESLHGLITAAAYDRPAIVITPKGSTNHKYVASAAWKAPLTVFGESWTQAVDLVPTVLADSVQVKTHDQSSEATGVMLEGHWQRLTQSLTAKRVGVARIENRLSIPIRLASYWLDAEAAKALRGSIQIFWTSNEGQFSESRSAHYQLEGGRDWVVHQITLPREALGNPLRIDPASGPGVIAFSAAWLVPDDAGAITRRPIVTESLTIGGTAVVLPDQEESRVIFAYADDPQLFLSADHTIVEVRVLWLPMFLPVGSGPYERIPTPTQLDTSLILAKVFRSVDREDHTGTELSQARVKVEHYVQQEELRAKLAQVVEGVEALTSEVAVKNAIISELTQKFAQETTRAEALSFEAIALKASLLETKRAADRAECGYLEDLGRRENAHRLAIDNLHRLLDEKDATAAAMESKYKLAIHTQQVEYARAFSESNTVLESLNRLLAERDDLLTQTNLAAEDALRQYEQEVEQILADFDEKLAGQSSRLELKEAELASQQDRLFQMEKSLSWRATAPFRAVRDALARLFR